MQFSQSKTVSQRLDPELASAAELFPPFLLDDIHQARAYMQAALESLRVDADKFPVTIEDIVIDCEEPKRRLRLRTYRTTNQQESMPLVLYLHGGGMVLSSPEGEDVQCMDYASAAQCIVVSVDYRLAPEHPYPAALNDAYEALVWLINNAESLGIDPSRVAVMGASAGGGLTAGLVRMVRDRRGPHIALQLPLYPMLDHRNLTVSRYEVNDARFWNRKVNQTAWTMYLGEWDEREPPAYASIANVSSFEALPKCYFFVGELDIFLDEAISYARNLLHAGVPTEFIVYPGCFHGFESLVPHAAVSRRARAGLIGALIREFHDCWHLPE